MPLFHFIQPPLYQGLLCILLTVVVTIVIRPENPDKVWVVCGLMYGFYILANSGLVFYAEDVWSYFFVSIGVSLLYLAVIAVVASLLIKAFRLEGSAESAMIFLIILFHPLVLLAVMLLKRIFSS